MKFGVFTVMLPDLTPEEAATALRDAGYDGVEWRVTHVPEARRHEAPSFWGNNLCTLAPTLEEAARAKQLAAETGLEIPNLGTYIAVGDVAATEEAMRFAQAAGAPQLRVSAGTLEGTYAASFKRAQDFLTEVASLSQRYGVRALVETHHNTICPSASLTHRLVASFDPAHIGVIYDPGNMVHEGFETYRLGLELLGDHLAHVHIKNAAYERPANGGVWQARWAALEDGIVDLEAFMAALKGIAYDGWLVVEDFSAARPSREALRHNLDIIQRLLDHARA